MAASNDLEEFIDETIRLGAEKDYHPTTFMDMRERLGTEEAIRRLVVSGEIQSGFVRLKDLGLIGYTIEAAVLKFPKDFKKNIQDAARFRLAQAGEGMW